MTNITFPIQLLSGDSHKIHSNATTEAKDKGTAFKRIVFQLCSAERDDSGDQKEVDIVYDLMPTFKFGDYGVLSLSFTGQTATLSCEKVCIRPPPPFFLCLSPYLILCHVVARDSRRILIFIIMLLLCATCQEINC